MRVDIKQLKYFIEIVQSDCNMSKAAKHLYVSQSALSQNITMFEESHQLQLFFREKGRLVGLTPIGHQYYKYALEMTGLHDKMMATIQKEAKRLNNVVRIAIPSITLRTILSGFILSVNEEFPDITLDIIEGGCQFLYEKLDDGEVDIAILMDPIERRGEYEDYTIIKDRFVVFMDRNHPLANQKKVEWDEVVDYSIVIFNDPFSTNRLVMSQFAQRQMKPKVMLHSSWWEYLIDLVTNSDVITILPVTTYTLMDQDQIVYRDFSRKLEFNIYISRNIYEQYPPAQERIYQGIRKYCKENLDKFH